MPVDEQYGAMHELFVRKLQEEKDRGRERAWVHRTEIVRVGTDTGLTEDEALQLAQLELQH